MYNVNLNVLTGGTKQPYGRKSQGDDSYSGFLEWVGESPGRFMRGMKSLCTVLGSPKFAKLVANLVFRNFASQPMPTQILVMYLNM